MQFPSGTLYCIKSQTLQFWELRPFMRFLLLLLSMQGRITLSIFPGGSVIGTVVKWLTEQEVGGKTSFSGDTSFPHFGDICPLSIVCMGQKVKENLSKEGKKKKIFQGFYISLAGHALIIFFVQPAGWTRKKWPDSHIWGGWGNSSHCAIVFWQWEDFPAIRIHWSVLPGKAIGTNRLGKLNRLVVQKSIYRLTSALPASP